MDFKIVEQDGAFNTKYYVLRLYNGYYWVGTKSENKHTHLTYTKDITACAHISTRGDAEDWVKRFQKWYDDEGYLLHDLEKLRANGGGLVPEQFRY